MNCSTGHRPETSPRDRPCCPRAFGERAGSEVTLRALVKGVKARRLPDLTDEWVSDVSEFEGVDELREQLRSSLEQAGLRLARERFRDELLDQMLAEVELEIPPALIGAESGEHPPQPGPLAPVPWARPPHLPLGDRPRPAAVRRPGPRRRRALAPGSGAPRSGGRRRGASRSTTTRLPPPSARWRPRRGVIPEEFARFMAESGQDRVLAGDILRRRALDRIMEASTAVDAEGEQIDLGAPAGEDADPDESWPGRRQRPGRRQPGDRQGRQRRHHRGTGLPRTDRLETSCLATDLTT